MIILHIEATTLPELEERLRSDLPHLFTGQGVLPLTLPAAPAPEPAAAPQEPAAAPAGRKPRGKAADAPSPAQAAPPADVEGAQHVNGAGQTTVATPPMELSALREVMGRLVETHPDKGAVVVGLLKEHAAGAKNLSSTEPQYYPALAAAAETLIASLASDPTA